eukprot:Plantae.Rhodophyta-Purpureofilum_apyrenoidigerum.ctg30525.p1 GENE.Plantae.Rhodophyta-Purpureofilum_apyrenoidigerum.ctg30525~~Plantae.Rhodophyta-Purpureofilum_apyrenoidigerum.ctg30525.p1  ORF type:complete len:211 (-),score=30.98 Plantae.Rhodophyta-Purpureofilum_apyrenoidigerum.ctg30525:78-710(-)
MSSAASGSNSGGPWMASPSGDIGQVTSRKHVLQSRFHFSFMRRGPSTRTEIYGSSIREIGTFGTVEDFWSYYNHLVRPNDLPVNTEYYLFRDSVRPMWEDPANKSGGRWTIRLKKGICNQAFEDLAMAFIGEQLDESDIVCGIALSIRFQEDVLSLWTRTSDDTVALENIRTMAREAMQEYISVNTAKEWEYKQHVAVDAPTNSLSSDHR